MAAWRDAIGVANVLTTPEVLGEVETATFGSSTGVVALLCPADRDEVQACVRIAMTMGVALYPVSRGRNWGLGSRVPARSGCAVMDLSRMDRIVDYDESLGYVTVEPGVTFEQVHAFLALRGSNLFASVPGAPPSASLIGNAVERGDGAGPYGERWVHACGMEVVLPTGEILETGFARFPGARTRRTSRDGVGPALDGLFTQSNLGIVTRMTFWLHPKPRDFRLFFCEVDDTEALGGLLDVLRPLVLDETVAPHGLTLWNRYKTMARLGRYPWETMDGRTPLTPQDIDGLSPWYACGALYGATEAMGQAAQEHVVTTLEKGGFRCRVEDLTGRPGEAAATPFLGTPTDANLRTLYWRKRAGPPSGMADPHGDRCGLVWLCTEVPFVGASAVDAVRLSEKVVTDHGFEPNLGATARSPRSLKLFLALAWDRDVEGEDDRAMACHDALLGRLVADGFLPYRLGIHSMECLPESPGYDVTLRRIKEALDPAGIMAPGRYAPRRERE